VRRGEDVREGEDVRKGEGVREGEDVRRGEEVREGEDVRMRRTFGSDERGGQHRSCRCPPNTMDSIPSTSIST
jgi:hypothetical protein